MTDDLVKRLRELTCNCYDAEVIEAAKDAMDDAADRIEKLEAALREIAEANSVQAGTDKDMYRRWRYVATNAIDIARKALEENNDPA